MDKVISVIVPVYNVINYLQKCIDSILTQSYKNLEIILIDDGSTDGSEKLCDVIANSDSRIRLIHKKNSGQSDSRNIALNIATGKYLTFIDSDDLFVPDILLRCVQKFNETNADVVCFGYCDDNLETGVKHYVIDGGFSVTGIEAARRMFCCDALDSNLWGKVYLRDKFNPYRLPSGKIYEDVIVTYKVLLDCETVVHIGECGYIHTSRTDSTTGSAYKEADWAYIEHTRMVVEDIKTRAPALENYALVFYRNAIKSLMYKLAYGHGNITKAHYHELKSEFSRNYKAILHDCTNKRDKLKLKLLKMKLLPIYYKIFKRN